MHVPRPLSSQPIPSTAKKVFSGILFDVYQWEQEQFDGSRKIFEKVKRKDTVGIIAVTKDKKILLTHQKQPGTNSFIGLPGGIIDDNEEPLFAAQRELVEETGYVSDLWSLFQSTQPASKVDWAIYIFIARNCEKNKEAELDSGEKIKIEAISWEDFLEILLDEEFRDHELVLKILKTLHKPNGEDVLREQILGI